MQTDTSKKVKNSSSSCKVSFQISRLLLVVIGFAFIPTVYPEYLKEKSKNNTLCGFVRTLPARGDEEVQVHNPLPNVDSYSYLSTHSRSRSCPFQLLLSSPSASGMTSRIARCDPDGGVLPMIKLPEEYADMQAYHWPQYWAPRATWRTCAVHYVTFCRNRSADAESRAGYYTNNSMQHFGHTYYRRRNGTEHEPIGLYGRYRCASVSASPLRPCMTSYNDHIYDRCSECCRNKCSKRSTPRLQTTTQPRISYASWARPCGRAGTPKKLGPWISDVPEVCGFAPVYVGSHPGKTYSLRSGPSCASLVSATKNMIPSVRLSQLYVWDASCCGWAGYRAYCQKRLCPSTTRTSTSSRAWFGRQVFGSDDTDTGLKASEYVTQIQTKIKIWRLMLIVRKWVDF